MSGISTRARRASSWPRKLVSASVDPVPTAPGLRRACSIMLGRLLKGCAAEAQSTMVLRDSIAIGVKSRIGS